MREIEIKARAAWDLASTVMRFESQGIALGSSVSQTDYIFVRAPLRFSEARGPGHPVIRVRLEEGDGDRTVYVTLKRDVTDQLDSIEYEVLVNSLDAAVGILRELGLHQVVEVQKIRRRGILGGFEVCVDEIPSLGVFIELEATFEGSVDIAGVRTRMWRELERFGISKDNEVTVGYDRLLEQYQQERFGP